MASGGPHPSAAGAPGDVLVCAHGGASGAVVGRGTGDPAGVWLADFSEPDFSSGLDSHLMDDAVEGVPDHVLWAGQDIPGMPS